MTLKIPIHTFFFLVILLYHRLQFEAVQYKSQNNVVCLNIIINFITIVNTDN